MAQETESLAPHALPVVFIVGPTAIGKTAAAVALAEALGGAAEIVSADSVQVYKRLDIGSAKPTAEERMRAVFHAIDLAEPDEAFTLADYRNAAAQALADVRARGKLPIVCGGTGLYIKALTQPMSIPHVAPDETLRRRWLDYLEQNGPGSLHSVLMRRDPVSAARLHVNDNRRIIRALEVIEHTGMPLSHWHSLDTDRGRALVDDAVFAGLCADRAWLTERIERRVEAMIAMGFVEEVQSLRRAGYDERLRSMQSLGYKELNAHLSGQMSRADALEQIKLRTKQFARRQMIWFRAEKRIVWQQVETKSVSEIVHNIRADFHLQSSAL